MSALSLLHTRTSGTFIRHHIHNVKQHVLILKPQFVTSVQSQTRVLNETDSMFQVFWLSVLQSSEPPACSGSFPASNTPDSDLLAVIRPQAELDNEPIIWIRCVGARLIPVQV